MRWARRVGAVVGLVALVLVSSISPARGQTSTPAGTLYELTARSSYQSGCFPPCLCPIMEQVPITGTFLLVPTAVGNVFDFYAVEGVDWTVSLYGGQTLKIGGSGTYMNGGEVTRRHRMELDLTVGDNAVQHFDSGLVGGGQDFPRISIVVSINDQVCYDTVITLDAVPKSAPPTTLPRHADFELQPDTSEVEFSLFTGGTTSSLSGSIQLFLGDPKVPVIALPGMVGLSVDGANLVAPNFEPDLPGLPEPLYMIQDPRVHSIGAWNTITGEIAFELSLIAANPAGGTSELPVPMPVRLSGVLSDAGLSVQGDNGNVPDGGMTLVINALEVLVVPPPIDDLWFSTEIGFSAGRISSADTATPVAISHGDLLSRRGHIVRTNHELTSRLGIMPIVPDLGLDAVTLGPRGQIWFSFEEDTAQIWSETLGVWLKHGDLLSERGLVVASNEELLARFVPMPPVADAGLDAVARAPNRDILFSVEQGFFSGALGRWVGHGDLLSSRGGIVRTNVELMTNFHPLDNMERPSPFDYGLDAIMLRPNGEIWFSLETGFQDTVLGPISDGDVLSTRGTVVVRNLDLVAEFAPLEDVDNFGLDAVGMPMPSVSADIRSDAPIDQSDLVVPQSSLSGGWR